MTVKRRSWWRKELTWVSARAVILHGHSALTTQCFSVHEILQATILERLPCPPQGDLPHSGIEPGSLKSPALAAGFFTTGATWEAFWLHKGKGKGKETEVAQSCPTLCDPVDGNLPGSSVHGIFQARVLEWVAISFSRGSSRPRDWTWVSRIAGRCFIVWATREAIIKPLITQRRAK